MTLDSILTALEKDSSIFVKLAPVAGQAIGLYKSYQTATTEAAKLGIIAQGVGLAAVSLAELGTLLGGIASAS